MDSSDDSYDDFEARKRDHIDYALERSSQTSDNALETIQLIHEAFPELQFEEVTIGHQRFGQSVPTPFLVSSMTAGHQKASALNHLLAEACETRGWVMGVGSQRRELSDPQAHQEWATLNVRFPRLTLFGNLGLSQLIQHGTDAVHRLINNLQAQAIIIHTNPLQECLQLEGTPQFRGGYQALETLCSETSIPVIVKETGCGFSTTTLQQLTQTGIAALDISGYGGTHWGRIEGMRATKHPLLAHAAQTFKNWGLQTLDVLLETQDLNLNYELWASGGIRSGLDAAKLLAIGAQTIGYAAPILKAALNGLESLLQRMEQYEFELKIALFCTGSKTIKQLKENQKWRLKSK